MRERNWQLLILIPGVMLFLVLGFIFNNAKVSMALGIFGGMGVGLTMFFFSTKYNDRIYDKENKQLEKEGKYRKTVKCPNCGTSHSFTPSHGVCMLEFLQDEKCTYCKCSLKNIERPNDEAVTQ